MNETVNAAFTGERDGSVPREYLSFTLGKEDYAMDILKVQEIRGYEEPTRFANSPDFIKGVVNLRGVIVPIIDLRVKFNVEKIEYLPTTAVIILNLSKRVVGIVVDSVSDVIALTDSQIRPAPEFSANVGSQFVIGLATVEDRMLIISDIEKIMFASDMGLVDMVDSLPSV